MLDGSQHPRAQTGQGRHPGKPSPPGPIKYTGPRSLSCDLTRPGLQSQGVLGQPRGREGKKEAASSEGPPESGRASLWTEVGRGSPREWQALGLPGERGGGATGSPGSPCWIPQCVILSSFSKASKPKEAGSSVPTPVRTGSRNTSLTWSRMPEWPGSFEEPSDLSGPTGQQGSEPWKHPCHLHSYLSCVLLVSKQQHSGTRS